MTGKTTFVLQTLFQGLSAGEAGIYVTTDDVASDKIERMERFGWRMEEFGGRIKIIDAYSAMAGFEVRILEKFKQLIILAKGGVSNLSDISIYLSKLISEFKGRKIRCVIDSLSPIILFNKFDTVITFIRQLIKKAKQEKVMMIFVIESGAHSEDIYEILKSLADFVIEMEKRREGNFLTIRGKKVPEAIYEFTIGERGMKIEE
jgi:KaiC/GvpD/RAD55 family RecA-like ATPase